MITIREIKSLFEKWHKIKQRVHLKKKPKDYNEREVWWCTLGQNIGNEHNGTGSGYQRPVLIIKGLSRTTCIVAPLTTSANKHKYRIPIGDINGRNASIVISQIKVIDTKRLVDKSIHTVEQELFVEIRKRISKLF